MGRRKFGSKAAYEASRAEARAAQAAWEKEMSMTDEERAKARAKDRLNEDPMMMHAMFLAAGLASGTNAAKADGEAAKAVELLRKRFT